MFAISFVAGVWVSNHWRDRTRETRLDNVGLSLPPRYRLRGTCALGNDAGVDSMPAISFAGISGEPSLVSTNVP
jgi:hypothetical protein